MRPEASGPDLQAGTIPDPAADCPGHPLIPIFSEISLSPGLHIEKSLISPYLYQAGLEANIPLNSLFFWFQILVSHVSLDW